MKKLLLFAVTALLALSCGRRNEPAVKNVIEPLPGGAIALQGGFENDIQNCIEHWNMGVMPYEKVIEFFRTGRAQFALGEMAGKALRSDAKMYRYTQDPALKELNLLHIVSEILLKKTKMRSLPCHIQLEHTSFCNARCIMCDHYIAHNRGAKHLALSSVRRLEPVLPYVQLIVLHGNGEPLLNPEIMPLMQTYASYGVKISLNTNLSILNDDILTMLRSNCQSLHVSCDGCTAEQYESIRLGLKFQTLLEHLNKLEQDAPEINKVLEVVLMRRNVASAVDFVNFASEHGFRSVRFNRLGVNEWIGNRKEADLGPMALSTLNAAKERGQLLGITVVTPSDASLCAGSDRSGGTSPQTVYDAAHSEKLHRYYPQYTNTIGCTLLPDSLLTEGRPLQPHCGLCEYPFAKTYIDLAGNVSICCPASRMPVGRISDEQPFSAIWNGPQYQILRRRFYEGNLPRLCETCFLLDTGSLQFLSDGG